MIKALLYKKEYWLIAGTIALALLCYQLAFKKTVQAWQTNVQLKAQLAQASDVADQPGYLERKARNLETILARYQTDTLNLRGNTIAAIASIAEKEGVKLSGVPNQDPAFNTARLIIQKLDFEGDYPALIRTLNHLENQPGMGVPRSVTVKTVEERASGNASRKTVMEILLEIKK